MRTFYHIKSAKKAFGKHLSPMALDHIIRYNFGVDFYGVLGWKVMQYKLLPLYPLANWWYKRIDHFDQLESVDEIIETLHEHVKRIMETADDEKYPPGRLESIFRIIGRSSHAITDIFSHSNLVELLYDYHREDTAAKQAADESGKELHRYIAEDGPLFSQLIDKPAHAAFREKFMPRLFSFQSLPDTGPKCHEECCLDWPTAKGAQKDGYPEMFEAAYGLTTRQLTEIVDTFFERLKMENPGKHELLTNAFRSDTPAPDTPGPAALRARWWSDRFDVWD